MHDMFTTRPNLIDICATCILFLPNLFDLLSVFPPVRWFLATVFGSERRHIALSPTSIRWREWLKGLLAHPLSQFLFDLSIFSLVVFFLQKVVPSDISASTLRAVVMWVMGVCTAAYSMILGGCILIETLRPQPSAYNISKLIFSALNMAALVTFVVIANLCKVDPFILWGALAVFFARECRHMLVSNLQVEPAALSLMHKPEEELAES